ncbi:putative iron-regulated membrane protein [Nocardioides daedukensis]|uniref:Putative iron-regulated membrane protein n=1 Tax=Nocardioides daedukensis TaxID=634462 RepID=A0A7Y9S7B4_9ACTN|nr:PepSY domain-containing protein [Nocardioides daedukensis]NYG60755.1 putative iron-regulated membrane protein [Nocardioides daedukensis]
MTLLDKPSPAAPMPAASNRTPSAGWFRAFWRWHFYASFAVVPILLVLSVTGLIYLLRFQIEPLLNADVMTVEQPADMDFTQPYSVQLAAVERAYPDATIVSMTEPLEEGRSTSFSILTADGEPRDVYVNPWGGEVLGDLNPDTTLSGTAVRLHADLMSGVFGDRLIELAICWAIVMALTGYYLFWRMRGARKRKPKALRSTHGRIGAFVGIGLLLLIVSGLPWTGVWGEKVQGLATDRDSSMWSTDPGAVSNPTSTLDESLPHSHAVPWAQGKKEVPRSGGGPGTEGHEGRSVASIDTAFAVAENQGLRHPMTVALPNTDDGVYSVIGYAFDAPSDEKTVHVGRFGGEVVSTYGYADYPGLAKVVAQGIGIHEGRSLGLFSFWFAVLMCLAVMASCVTGPLMWWRRRPDRSLGAPRGRMPVASSPFLLVALVALGLFLPLFGISVLIILILDQLVVRRVPALARFFNAG